MRTKATGFAMAVLFASAAAGQEPAERRIERTSYLTHIAAAQDFQELATVVRSIGDIREVRVDIAQKTLALGGTVEQAALAEWLVSELDKPTGAQSSIAPGANPLPHEYRMPGSRDDVVRVFYVRHAGTPENLQELVTAVRSIGDIPRLFVYHAQEAVVLRGTAEQLALAEWLVHELDRPPAAPSPNPRNPHPVPHEYRIPGGDGEMVRAFYLFDAGPQDLGKAAAAVRSATGVRAVFVNTAQRAVVMRGTAGQIAVAERLIQELDHPD